MRTRTMFVALLIVVLLGLVGCQTKVINSNEGVALNTVTAQGDGKAAAAPDQAEMSFGVSTRASEAKSALDNASKTANDIVAALKKAGVAEEDIQTQNVALSPEYDYPRDGAPRVTGYQASVQVRATMKDLAIVGDVITVATDAGANEIYGPSFTLSEDADARDEAIADAITDARRRADAMAKAAGKTVGEILSVSETGLSVPPIMYERSAYAMDEAGVAPPIEPGQLDVNASVTVVFELK